ncbi:uncharacterized protein LOC135385182 [Ornithodoros turicata]|uniref:uncharacterized protein LOC135385182 n=1 Tax=Ornithodoros turicata TaxID=34597 RepID=UPI003138C8E0
MDCVIDLVTYVQQAKANKLIVIAVFLDIRRAFDTASHAHILAALLELGVDGKTIRWIEHYLTGRTIFMRTNKGDSHRHQTSQGVPQGGVLSPTLFNVLMAQIIKVLPSTVQCTVYADDICFWASGIQARHLKSKLQYALTSIELFLEERAMDVSPEKTVYLPFTAKRLPKFELTLQGKPVKRVTKHKFLGIQLNRNLTWTDEIERIRIRTKPYLNIIRALGGYRSGNTTALRTLHRSLIRQTLSYGLPVIHGLSPFQEKKLQSIIAQSQRTILGLPRLTRTNLVLAEAREPPIKVLRDQESQRHIIRLITRHSSHPLVSKLQQRNRSTLHTCFHDLAQNLPRHRMKDFHRPFPPWTLQPVPTALDIPGIKKKMDTPAVVLKMSTIAYLHDFYSEAEEMFTDGSCTDTGSSSAIHCASFTEGYRLSHRTSSTNAELYAIYKAFKHISTTDNPIWITCTDSKPAIQSLQFPDMNNSLVYKIYVAHQDIVNSGKTVTLQWVPSHCGIPGNETADATARMAHSQATVSSIPFTPEDAKCLLTQTTKEKSVKLWKSYLRSSDYLTFIDPDLAFTPPRNVPRSLQTALHRTRLGVLLTNSVVNRYRPSASTDCPTCGTTEDTLHIIMQCQKYSTERSRLESTLAKLDDRPLSFVKIIGAWQNESHQTTALTAFCNYLKDSRIITRY